MCASCTYPTKARAYEPSGLGPEEFAALIKRDLDSRGLMVKLSGAKAE